MKFAVYESVYGYMDCIQDNSSGLTVHELRSESWWLSWEGVGVVFFV